MYPPFFECVYPLPLVSFSVRDKIPKNHKLKEGRFIWLTVSSGFGPLLATSRTEMTWWRIQLMAARKQRDKGGTRDKSIGFPVTPPLTHFQSGPTSSQPIRLPSTAPLCSNPLPKGPAWSAWAFWGHFRLKP